MGRPVLVVFAVVFTYCVYAQEPGTLNANPPRNNHEPGGNSAANDQSRPQPAMNNNTYIITTESYHINKETEFRINIPHNNEPNLNDRQLIIESNQIQRQVNKNSDENKDSRITRPYWVKIASNAPNFDELSDSHKRGRFHSDSWKISKDADGRRNRNSYKKQGNYERSKKKYHQYGNDGWNVDNKRSNSGYDRRNYDGLSNLQNDRRYHNKYNRDGNNNDLYRHRSNTDRTNLRDYNSHKYSRCNYNHGYQGSGRNDRSDDYQVRNRNGNQNDDKRSRSDYRTYYHRYKNSHRNADKGWREKAKDFFNKYLIEPFLA